MAGIPVAYFAYAAEAVAAVGAITSAQAQSNALNYNAKIDAQNAVNASRVANVNEDAVRRVNAQKLGNLKAGLLQSGIGTGGTAVDLLATSAANTELDALNTRYEGVLKSRSYSQQADVNQFQANSAVTAGYLSAGAHALSAYGGGYTKPQSYSNASGDLLTIQ